MGHRKFINCAPICFTWKRCSAKAWTMWEEPRKIFPTQRPLQGPSPAGDFQNTETLHEAFRACKASRPSWGYDLSRHIMKALVHLVSNSLQESSCTLITGYSLRQFRTLFWCPLYRSSTAHSYGPKFMLVRNLDGNRKDSFVRKTSQRQIRVDKRPCKVSQKITGKTKTDHQG